MALLATIALLLAARSAAQGGEPCSLNGELKSGACVCDPGWSGAKCSALAVAPSYVLWPQLSDGDPRTHDASSLSWGGSVLQDKATKRWHGWFNAGCQTPTSFMHTYLTGAVHGVADRPEGPFSFVDVSVPGELENPMAVSDGEGGVLIAYLDHGLPNGSAVNIPMPCFGASNGTETGWAIHTDGDIECGINPSLFRLGNGTWLLATRYDHAAANRSHLTLATAPSWKGPYTIVSSGDQWAAGVATGGSEDPVVFKNKRGYHMIHHDGPHGRHVWSVDGLEWFGYVEPAASSDTSTDAYNMSIGFHDGQHVEVMRRERPWVMLDTEGHPLHLVTGCETCGAGNKNCRSYTVLTPLLPLGRAPA